MTNVITDGPADANDNNDGPLREMDNDNRLGGGDSGGGGIGGDECRRIVGTRTTDHVLIETNGNVGDEYYPVDVIEEDGRYGRYVSDETDYIIQSGENMLINDFSGDGDDGGGVTTGDRGGDGVGGNGVGGEEEMDDERVVEWMRSEGGGEDEQRADYWTGDEIGLGDGLEKSTYVISAFLYELHFVCDVLQAAIYWRNSKLDIPDSALQGR